jgi:excisionase family DNA binding protein
MKKELWLTPDDITPHLSINRDTINRWIDDRSVPAHKVGRLLKFKVSEVDAWVCEGIATVDYNTNDIQSPMDNQ